MHVSKVSFDGDRVYLNIFMKFLKEFSRECNCMMHNSFHYNSIEQTEEEEGCVRTEIRISVKKVGDYFLYIYFFRIL